MKVIVGLGNPGEKYKLTRHNIGFSVVDKIAGKYSQNVWIKKFNGRLCQCWSDGKKFVLLKPETYMNNSGQSLSAIVSYYKLNLNDIIVLHDDLDLKVGQVKIKHGGGHAGHNGIRSINQAIGDQYIRIRIGIGHPGNKTEVSSYVLANFTESDNIQMEHFTKHCVAKVHALITNDYSDFLETNNSNQSTNRKTNPQVSQTNQPNSLTQINSSKAVSTDNKFSVLKSIIKKLT
jgi:PTH1 family peptidyl-tRNA hydrolase